MIDPTPQAKARRIAVQGSTLFDDPTWVSSTATIGWAPNGSWTVTCWSCDWKAQSKDSAEVKHLAELH